MRGLPAANPRMPHVRRSFAKFRRAKLMIADVDDDVLEAAAADPNDASLVAEIDLTDERGGPRCARVRPPIVRWSLAT